MRFLFTAWMLCFLVAVVAGEYSLRLLHPDWSTTPIYEDDKASIFVPRSGMTDPLTSSLGAWGEELAPEADTVLVFGDSNIEAAFADWTESYPVRLAQALGSVQVANFGVAGYGPDQSVLRLGSLLSKKLLPQRVHAVVLHIFADNDLGDLIRNNLPAFNPNIKIPASRLQPEFTWAGNVRNRYLAARVILDSLQGSRVGAFLLPANIMSQGTAIFMNCKCTSEVSIRAYLRTTTTA